MTDFSQYKFRCSSLPALMTPSRSKSSPLSETSKTLIRECWIKEVFDRESRVFTPAMQKGVACESDSLSLIESVTGEVFFKNQESQQNDFLTGTPDVITDDTVIDIKTPWDIFSYASVDEEKARKTYFWQLAGYCFLTGKKKAKIIYALVNTPENLIEKELYKMNLQSEAEVERARKNFIFDDIPAEKRLKRYQFEITDDDFEVIKRQVELARAYMSGLSL